MTETVTNKKSTNETEKRLGLNGIFVVVTLLALYGISCTVVKSWQIYTDEFFGVIELGIFSVVVSAIWLFMYWFLDCVQHESIKMTLLTFLLGAVTYLASKGVLDWIISTEISVFMENIGLPVFSFFIIFVFIIVKMQSFDELVDSFIYGGFLGTGIAFAVCMTEFVHFNSLDGQYVIIELITRISVYAAICSLGGFLIHQALLRKKIIYQILSIILMAILFVFNSICEQICTLNVKVAEFEILPVLASIVFTSVLVAVVVILIHRILKKGEFDTDSLKVPQTRTVSIIMLVMTVLFLAYALVIRYEEFRTTKFVSSNEKWTFCLPVGFSCIEETSSDSIFDFAEPTGNVFYKSKYGSINIYLFYDAKNEMEKISDSYSLGAEKGWAISVTENNFVAGYSSRNPYMMYQRTYRIKKGENLLLIDVFSDKKDDSEANRAARILIRTLEAKND